MAVRPGLGRAARGVWLLTGLASGLAWVPLLELASAWVIPTSGAVSLGLGLAVALRGCLDALVFWLFGASFGAAVAVELTMLSEVEGAEDPVAYVLLFFSIIVVVPAAAGYGLGALLRRVLSGGIPKIDRRAAVATAFAAVIIVGLVIIGAPSPLVSDLIVGILAIVVLVGSMVIRSLRR